MRKQNFGHRKVIAAPCGQGREGAAQGPGRAQPTISNMPGNPYLRHGRLLVLADHVAVRALAPMVMLAAAVALVALCLRGRWGLRDAPGPAQMALDNAGRPPQAVDPVS
jgi:hypothetical protein